jgi:hypothetical protein
LWQLGIHEFLGRRVAIIDRPEMFGGVCLHTARFPAKTLREAVLYLTGMRLRAFYGADYTLKPHIRVEEPQYRRHAGRSSRRLVGIHGPPDHEPFACPSVESRHGLQAAPNGRLRPWKPCGRRKGTTLLRRGPEAEAMLYAVGRQPNTDRLNLDAIGCRWIGVTVIFDSCPQYPSTLSSAYHKLFPEDEDRHQYT